MYSCAETRKKFKEMCKTCWVECHDAFEVMIELFLHVLSCLEAIANSHHHDKWNRESHTAAHSLFLGMYQFSFIVALVLTQKIRAYTKALSIKLQGHCVDVQKIQKNNTSEFSQYQC